jgi:glycosyltransferase involved in cell wall biosynthesis
VALLQPNIAMAGVQARAIQAPLSGGRRIWYEQWTLPRRLSSGDGDVFHFPDYQLPLLLDASAPLVVTVHDLAAFVLPEVFPESKTRTKRFLMRRSVNRAAKIIVPSAATRGDLMRVLGVNPDKIAVVPHGVKQTATPIPTRAYPHPYFLAVGTIEPRKNFGRLIKAYHLLTLGRKDVPDLVIAGRLGWMYDETLELPAKLGVAEKVKFLQYVSEDVLAALYRDAVAFVYPSLYEGFGLPVIEAMQAGIPVVTSSRGALGELGPPGAVFRVDPEDIADIKDQIERVLDGGSEVRQCVADAKQWASALTWEEAARKTRRVYEAIVLGG